MAAKRRRDDSGVPRVKGRSDVYTGMLVVSLAATLVGLVFVYLDYSQYGPEKPPKMAARPAVGGAAR